MKRILLVGVVAMALSACSKDSDDGAAKKGPGKTTHTQNQCPSAIEGHYTNIDGNGHAFDVVVENGFYVIKFSDGSTPSVVNGTPITDKSGAISTAACQGGQIVVAVVNKDGSRMSLTMSKVSPGLKIESIFGKETGVYHYAREGGMLADPPGEPPKQGGSSSAVDCNGGFEMTYQYSYNGCDTGEQKFCSIQAYCSGLKNESLNKGCAKQQRLEAFNAVCKQP